LKGRTICFDLETTGFTREDCIIEIGAVEFFDGVRTGCLFQAYINPRHEIHPKALEVHGMNGKRLAKALDVSVVIPSFMSWVGSSPLIAHNSKFDLRLLFQDLKHLGHEHLLSNKIVFCTQTYYRKKYPRKAFSLNDAAVTYGLSIEYRTIHSALLDAEILGKVFISEATSDLESISHDLWKNKHKDQPRSVQEPSEPQLENREPSIVSNEVS